MTTIARRELRPFGLDGISEDQIAQHWALYEGYVKNAAALSEKLARLAKTENFGPEFTELKRHWSFEINGIVLHELYFEGLRKGAGDPGDAAEVVKRLKKDFGGLSAWGREFEALGKRRGTGWVILYLNPRDGSLVNAWISSHEDGHPAGFVPLLVMDVWEHAYMVDRGASGRGEYIQAFFRNVDWNKVEERLGAWRKSS